LSLKVFGGKASVKRTGAGYTLQVFGDADTSAPNCASIYPYMVDDSKPVKHLFCEQHTCNKLMPRRKTGSCGASWGRGGCVSLTTIADGWLRGRTEWAVRPCARSPRSRRRTPY
jgi:hypothetical protein